MDEATNPKSSNPKLSVKKESPQQLKVRTDLKGGIAVSCGGVLYQEASLRRIQFRRGSDQSRHGGSLSRGGPPHLRTHKAMVRSTPRAPCLLNTAHELDESGGRRIQAVGSRCDGQHKNALIPKLRENRSPDRAVPWCVGPMVEPRVTDRRRLWTESRVQRPRTRSWH